MCAHGQQVSPSNRPSDGAVKACEAASCTEWKNDLDMCCDSQLLLQKAVGLSAGPLPYLPVQAISPDTSEGWGSHLGNWIDTL